MFKSPFGKHHNNNCFRQGSQIHDELCRLNEMKKDIYIVSNCKEDSVTL